MIKYKIDEVRLAMPFAVLWVISVSFHQNITSYLSDPPPDLSPRISSEQPTTGGGLKRPPFSPRKRDELNNYEAPVSYMNKEQANQLKGFIFKQLHQFDE
jgi:serine/threonine-protein phosphatase 4 regulatory subunit 2